MSHHTCPVVLPEEQRFAVYALDCPYCILMLTLDIISPDFLVDVYWRPNVEWWARCKGHIFPFPPAQTRSKGTMTWKSSHVMVVSSANTEDSPLTCHFHSFGSLWASMASQDDRNKIGALSGIHSNTSIIPDHARWVYMNSFLSSSMLLCRVVVGRKSHQKQ